MDIVDRIPENLTRFLVTEFSAGTYQPSVIMLYLASDLFKEKVKMSAMKLRKQWYKRQT